MNKEQRHDQIIVNHGTRPNDDLYFELKPIHQPRSGRLLRSYRWPASDARDNPSGKFQLFRIGDAVAAQYPRRNIRRAKAGEGHLRRWEMAKDRQRCRS